MADTYRVRRFYRDEHPPRLIKEGLTLQEAQAHCQSPETSSSTCTSEEGRLHTEQWGEWFDGYDTER